MMSFICALFLVFFTWSSMAEVSGGGGWQPSVRQPGVTNISADYFRGGSNPVLARNTHLDFTRKFRQLSSHPELRGSEAALERALAFYYKNKNGIPADCGGERANHNIQGDWIVVTDFTKPIDEKRQFYINLQTGEVRSAYASHGGGSNYPTDQDQIIAACPTEHRVHCGRGAYACKIPISFDDVAESHKTQTGFYLTGEPYRSSKQTFRQGQPPSGLGETNGIRLHGVNSSNKNAFSRAVVYHRSSYLFQDRPNACGFSWGCPATDPQTFEDIKDELVEGTLFYNHTIAEELTVNPQC